MQSHTAAPASQDSSKDKIVTDEKKGTEAQPSMVQPPRAKFKSLPGPKLIPMDDLKSQVKIGSGGYGDVYKATWFGEDVAVKKLHYIELSGDTEDDFNREIKMMMEANYPQAVRFYGVSKDTAEYAIVMEFMTDGNLRKYMADKTNKFTWAERYQIAFDIASGLSQLHSGSIIHRDLKSLNVLLYRKGKDLRAKISDFGLATVKVSSSAASTKKRSDTVGTVRWRAPELFRRGTPHSASTDVYSLGMILWEIASRQLPYADGDDDQAKDWIKEGENEKIPADCPAEFAAIILSCWEKDPKLRPTAAEIVAKLEPMLKKEKEKYNVSKTSYLLGTLIKTIDSKLDHINTKADMIMSEQELTRATISAPPILAHVDSIVSTQPMITGMLSLEEPTVIATPALTQVAGALSLEERKVTAAPASVENKAIISPPAKKISTQAEKVERAKESIKTLGIEEQIKLQRDLEELFADNPKINIEIFRKFKEVLPKDYNFDLSKIRIDSLPLLAVLVELEGNQEIVLNMIKEVLKYPIDIDAVSGSYKKTALHLAVLGKKVDIILALIKAGADPRKKYERWEYSTGMGEMSETNCLQAWRHQYYGPIEFPMITDHLKDTITRLNLEDAAKEAAAEELKLQQAFQKEQSPKIELDEVKQKIIFNKLLPFLNPRSSNSQYITLGQEELDGVIANLPKNGVMNFDSFPINGSHPLIHIVTRDLRDWYSTKIIEKLLEHTINVNATDENGRTVLHHAAVKQNATLLLMLLAAGADPRLIAPSTAQFYKDEELDVLATWKAYDRENRYPAITELLETLIKDFATGVSLEERKRKVYECQRHIELQSKLNSLLNKKTQSYGRSYRKDCTEQDVDELNKILPPGSKFNLDIIRLEEGVSPLILLSEEHSWHANQIIKRLLELKIDPNKPVNQHGKNALEIAMKNNATTLMEILSDAGAVLSKKESKAPVEQKSTLTPAQGFMKTFENPAATKQQFNLSLIKQVFPYADVKKIESLSAGQLLIWTGPEEKEPGKNDTVHLFDLKANKIVASSLPNLRAHATTRIAKGLLTSHAPLELLDPVTLEKIASSDRSHSTIPPLSLGNNDYLVFDGFVLWGLHANDISNKKEFSTTSHAGTVGDRTIQAMTQLASGKTAITFFRHSDSKSLVQLKEKDPETKTYKIIKEFDIDVKSCVIHDAIALPNDKMLFNVGYYGEEYQCKIFDIAQGKWINEFKVPKLTNCQLLADGKTLVGVCPSGKLYVHDTKFTYGRTYPVPNLKGLTVSPDGRLFLLTNDTILEYELPCMKEELSKPKPSEDKTVVSTPSVESVAPVTQPLTTAKAGLFAVPETKVVLDSKVFLEGRISAIQTLSKDQLAVWTAYNPQPTYTRYNLNIYDIKTQKIIKTYPREFNTKMPVTLTASGYLIPERPLELLDAETMQKKYCGIESNFLIPPLPLTENRIIVTNKNDVKLYDLSNPSKPLATKNITHQDPDQGIKSLAPLSANQFAATCHVDGKLGVHIFEVKGDELHLLKTIKTSSSAILNIFPLEKDQFITYAEERGFYVFRTYDMKSGECVYEKKAPHRSPCAILADGKTIVSASNRDKSLSVYDTQTKDMEKYTIDGIQNLAVHPDGRLLVIVNDQAREYVLPCMKKEAAHSLSLSLS